MSDGGMKLWWPPKQEGILRLKNEAGNSIEYNRNYCRASYLPYNRIEVDGNCTVCTASLPYQTVVTVNVLNGITEVRMINKTKGQLMQYVPETILPGGLMLDGCLQLMPAPSLILNLGAMPF